MNFRPDAGDKKSSEISDLQMVCPGRELIVVRNMTVCYCDGKGG